MSAWISVGDLESGFAPGSYALPQASELNNKELLLNFGPETSIKYSFGDEYINWDGPTGGKALYRATSLRPKIFFVDFISKEPAESTTLVLDLEKMSFTAVVGTLPSQEEINESIYHRALSGKDLTAVKAEFFHGTVDRPYVQDSQLHSRTTELIGSRNRYRYSDSEMYEHIYLNSNFYTWQCLSGAEKGLCDTDKCHYFKISDELYLFVWQEKIVPTLGVVTIDLRQHRSDGKICGYENNSLDKLSNFRMASYCKVLNVTNYDEVLKS